MNPDRYALVKDLFAQARGLPPAERADFLSAACGTDSSLLEEVRELLEYEEVAQGGVLARALDDATLPDEEGPSRQFEGVEGPGSVLDGYELIEVLGEGGFGTVFRARQSEPVQREVALKIVKLGMDTRQVVARFEAERQALARMEHPSIASVHDAGVTERGRPYFVMELVAGEPITRHCKREGLSVRARIELFGQVCRAVQHAHQKGVLHRDLKPSNLLVTRVDGAPLAKVIDFGIAKAIETPLTDASMATEAFQVMGTPAYMSPEQASGRDVDTRADVYALGIVLYELLTGTSPFDDTTPGSGPSDLGELLRHIHEVTPPKPSTRASQLASSQEPRQDATAVVAEARSLRGDLDWIVMKAIEKDRERRYASALDLAEDLENHLAHRPVSAGPPSALYRMRKLARRNRALVGASMVIALTLVTGLAVLVWSFFTVRDERDASELAREQEASARAEAEQARADEELARNQAVEQRDRAEAALEESQAVIEFLATALAAVQPEEMGHEVTMRAVLDQAALHIADRLAGQQRVEARLRFVIGSSYLGLGALHEAEPHLIASLDLYRETDGEQAPRTNQARRELARLYARQDRPEDAMPLLDALIGTKDGYGEGGDTEMFDLWNAVAVLHLESWENQRAAEIWEEQIHLAEGQPDLAEERIIAIGNLALALEQMGRPAEALDLQRIALDYYTREFGPESAETLNKLNNVATALTALGRYEEAEEICNDLIAIRERVLGPRHPDTMGSVYNLALLHLRVGRLQDAEELTALVLEYEVETLGDAHRWTIATRNQLGVVLLQQGMLQEAEDILREANELARDKLGLEDSWTLNVLHGLADTLVARGQSIEARELYEESLPFRQRIDGPTSRALANLQQSRAHLLHRVGRLEDSETLMRATLERRALDVGEDSTDVAGLRNGLASILTDLGRLEDSERELRAALETFEVRFGALSPSALESRAGLARVFALKGAWDRQATFRQRSEELVRELGTQEHASPLLLSTGAALLLELGDSETAAFALELARRASAATAGEHPDVLQVLARAEHATGQVEAAQRTRGALMALLPADDPLRAHYDRSW